MAARILVVADNRSLSLGLAGQDFDVVELHPEEVAGWAETLEAPDLVLVGVETPVLAMDILGECKRRHLDVPVLLIASDAAGWNSVRQLEASAVEILTLPVSRLSLVNAVRRALDNRSSAGATPEVDLTSTEPEPVAAHAPDSSVVVASAVTEDVPVTGRGTQQRIVAARSTAGLRERLAQRPAVAAERASGEVLDHRSSAREQSAEWSLVREAATTATDGEAPVRSRAPHELVTSLLPHVHALVDVRDVANALVEEAAARGNAAYGAVLLPDDGTWRVCGAIGVRPLEWRYVVEADSWLVTTVIRGQRGVIVEDSDIARQRLGGAPLTHHQHLLAAPVPEAQGLLILARDADAFDEDQLNGAATACADAGALLAECLQVRALARALSDFRDLDG